MHYACIGDCTSPPVQPTPKRLRGASILAPAIRGRGNPPGPGRVAGVIPPPKSVCRNDLGAKAASSFEAAKTAILACMGLQWHLFLRHFGRPRPKDRPCKMQCLLCGLGLPKWRKKRCRWSPWHAKMAVLAASKPLGALAPKSFRHTDLGVGITPACGPGPGGLPLSAAPGLPKWQHP